MLKGVVEYDQWHPRVLKQTGTLFTAYSLVLMSNESSDNSSEVGRLLRRAAAGDPDAWRALFDRDRQRLRRMVALRMDRRLQGRVDPSDVIQDAHIEAMTRLPEYLRESNLPFFLWPLPCGTFGPCNG